MKRIAIVAMFALPLVVTGCSLWYAEATPQGDGTYVIRSVAPTSDEAQEHARTDAAYACRKKAGKKAVPEIVSDQTDCTSSTGCGATKEVYMGKEEGRFDEVLKYDEYTTVLTFSCGG